MTRFYDDYQILEITLASKETGEDFSSDFFEDACDKRNYNECLKAYKVEDVDYLLDFAQRKMGLLSSMLVDGERKTVKLSKRNTD